MKRILLLIAQRIALGFFVLFVVSLMIAFIVELLPGDACETMMGQFASPETVSICRAQLRLDEPIASRYLSWLMGLFTGDMGVSLSKGRPIAELIGARIGNTFFLSAFAAALSVPIALLFGTLCARYRETLFDRSVSVVGLVSVSFPEFFVAYAVIFIFATQLGYFPGISNVSDPDMTFMGRVYRTFLPALTLTTVVTAHMMRLTRASILNLLATSYIEMAQLKGASDFSVIFRHALPNALAPIANIIALMLAYMLVGTVVVEAVFVYPGIGQLLVDAVAVRDLPLVQAIAMLFAGIYITLNLAADVISIMSNPRILHPR